MGNGDFAQLLLRRRPALVKQYPRKTAHEALAGATAIVVGSLREGWSRTSRIRSTPEVPRSAWGAVAPFCGIQPMWGRSAAGVALRFTTKKEALPPLIMPAPAGMRRLMYSARCPRSAPCRHPPLRLITLRNRICSRHGGRRSSAMNGGVTQAAAAGGSSGARVSSFLRPGQPRHVTGQNRIPTITPGRG